MCMNFKDINEFKQAGFIGFKEMIDLFNDSSIIPDSMGVYLVLKPDNMSCEFLTVGSGGYFKGKNPNVSIEELKRNWVDNTNVLYIGKATSLKSRLRLYFGFGQGKNVGHYGGRLIWQLSYSKELVVCWKVLTTDPREYELELIRKFVSIYGSRTFANLKD
jgi:hypothetical protein